MSANRGRTSLRRSPPRGPAMQAYDALPPELRAWLAQAILPWSPRSVRRAYACALAQTGDPRRALGALDRLQARLVARDARAVWGEGHPLVPPHRPASGRRLRDAGAAFSAAGGEAFAGDAAPCRLPRSALADPPAQRRRWKRRYRTGQKKTISGSFSSRLSM